MLFIQTIEEFVLTYKEEDLINNKFIKDSLIDKIFFGNFSKENCIIFYHNEETLKILDKWIRQGELCCNITKPNDDLIEMLDYIAGQNNYLCKIVPIMKYGARDLFGRELHLKSYIKYSDLDYILPKIESDKIIVQIKNILEPILINYVSRACKYFNLADIESEKKFFLETTYNDFFATEKRGRGIPRIINCCDPITVKKIYISDDKFIIDINPQYLLDEEYRQTILNNLITKYNSFFQ
ncbi:hypothetical protein QJ854_gp791 [Moumouvirus goulette]|uniref:DUF5866 domain-containing protein n=1 Tax=Moumouvirus goulette TaxID=1247379 RepID=M1PM42_9VIRU|nr:hypothetical protein QJ854_gp791 [Moumouvirus goulette]AGF84991.1 hypothetical protein glt_00182 [Moumouvirus goulette]